MSNYEKMRLEMAEKRKNPEQSPQVYLCAKAKQTWESAGEEEIKKETEEGEAAEAQVPSSPPAKKLLSDFFGSGFFSCTSTRVDVCICLMHRSSESQEAIRNNLPESRKGRENEGEGREAETGAGDEEGEV